MINLKFLLYTLLLLLPIFGSTHASSNPLGDLFNDIRAGYELNLEDPWHRFALALYLDSRFGQTESFSAAMELRSKILNIRDFFRVHPQTNKIWDAWRFYDPERRDWITVRTMNKFEKAFRGICGWDCSSNTRLLRAFEPAELHFAIEEEKKLRATGQVEIVLGHGDGLESIGFLERFQSPRRYKESSLYSIFLSIYQTLNNKQISLTAPKAFLNGPADIYENLGHSVTNNDQILPSLRIVLQSQFRQVRFVSNFNPIPARYSAYYDNEYVFIAGRVAAQNIPLVVLQDKESDQKLLPAVLTLSGQIWDIEKVIQENITYLPRAFKQWMTTAFHPQEACAAVLND